MTKTDGEPTAALVASVAAAAQAATLVITWELWAGRRDPPNLPAVAALGDVDWRLPLLVLAAVAALRPRLGAPLFVAGLGGAVLGDQMRLQPEVLSLAFLMLVPALGASGRAVARWHLGALWLWAGLNKALSIGWSSVGAGAIAGYLDLPSLRPLVGIALPVAEVLLGLSVLWRRAWPVTAAAGAALHVGIFVALSSLFGDWNPAVWPWNLALAYAAFHLFGPAAPMTATPAVARAVAVVLVAYPALFYVGAVDAYLAHNVYAANGATARVCDGDRQRCSAELFTTIDDLGVPVPPQPRLFRQVFDETCEPGSVLRIVGRRTRFDDPPTIVDRPCPASLPSEQVSE